MDKCLTWCFRLIINTNVTSFLAIWEKTVIIRPIFENQKMQKMTKIDQKCSKMSQNWSKTSQNDPKTPKDENDQNIKIWCKKAV